MRKIFYVLITFAVCALSGAGGLWIGFAAAFLLLSLKNANSSILWEIPMGVLICSIASDVFSGGEITLIRILIPITAALFAGFYPKKLFLFFPLAIVSLVLRDTYGISVMCASMWCGVRNVFAKNNFTIKKALLQGNNLTIPK